LNSNQTKFIHRSLRCPALTLIVAALLTVFEFTPCTGQVKAQTSETTGHSVKVMAHYMPWFHNRKNESGKPVWNHWQWNGKGTVHNPNNFLEPDRRDIASVFYPLIQPYDSHDSRVIEYHILTAKLAGIEGFICNWYGPGSFTDQTVASMTTIAKQLDFKIAICMEEKTFFPPYSQATDRQEIIGESNRQLNHVLEKYCSLETCLQHNNSPVVFLFNGFGEGTLGAKKLSVEETQKVLDQKRLRDCVLVRNELAPEYFPKTQGVFAWCRPRDSRLQFYEQATKLKTDKKLRYFSAVVSPGFDDSPVHGWGNEPRKIERRGLDEYRDNWNEVNNLAQRQLIELVQIATWNDFEEGTTIEPTREYGFTILDETEKQIERLTKRKAVLSDNQFGLRVFQMRCRTHMIPSEQLRLDFQRSVDEVVQKMVKQSLSSESISAELERLKGQLDAAIGD